MLAGALMNLLPKPSFSVSAPFISSTLKLTAADGVQLGAFTLMCTSFIALTANVPDILSTNLRSASKAGVPTNEMPPSTPAADTKSTPVGKVTTSLGSVIGAAKAAKRIFSVFSPSIVTMRLLSNLGKPDSQKACGVCARASPVPVSRMSAMRALSRRIALGAWLRVVISCFISNKYWLECYLAGKCRRGFHIWFF